VTLRTFGGFGQFLPRKLEAAGPATGWFNDGPVLSVFETAKEMSQIVGDSTGGYVHEPRDLANRQRIAEQHLN
jgi:hypothetical protein